VEIELKNLLDIFKATDESSLFKTKSEGKQTRYTMTGTKPKLVEMTAEQCKKLCEKAGIEYLDGYEYRIFEGLTTDETPDRYGDIVRYTGADFKNYLKNPVVMLSHEHSNFPIGNSVKIWKDDALKGVKSWDLLLDNRVDDSGRSDLAFKFRKSGIMPGISIGFMVNSAKTDHSADERKKLGLGKWGVEILSFDYLEHSVVSIPANPEALTNMLKAIDNGMLRSIFSKEDLFSIEKLKFISEDSLNIFEDFVIKTPTIIIPSIDTKTIDEIVRQVTENTTKCVIESVNIFTKKIDEVLAQVQTLVASIPPSTASGAERNAPEEGMYASDFLKDFQIKTNL